MHPAATRSEALELIAAGVNDCEIARRLDVPRTTVREWRAPHYFPQDRDDCPRCWRAAKPMWFTPEDYAFLLGMYLGDGCISRMGRTYRLRISLDTKYPGIIEATEQVLTRCFPFSAVGTLITDQGSCTVVGVYSNHLPCLFPQHGPGKKHERAIRLEQWQTDLVDRARWSLLRGLIWSDGCSFINRHGKYEDLCYAFSNCSTDLLELCAETCRSLALEHRYYPARLTSKRLVPGMVRINRRDPVSRMLEHVGIKQ